MKHQLSISLIRFNVQRLSWDGPTRNREIQRVTTKLLKLRLKLNNEDQTGILETGAGLEIRKETGSKLDRNKCNLVEHSSQLNQEESGCLLELKFKYLALFLHWFSDAYVTS
jgi:hypothetical protein